MEQKIKRYRFWYKVFLSFGIVGIFDIFTISIVESNFGLNDTGLASFAIMYITKILLGINIASIAVVFIALFFQLALIWLLAAWSLKSKIKKYETAVNNSKNEDVKNKEINPLAAKRELRNTISHLNSKAWYRFLKVVYILIFLVIAISLISGMISSEKPREVVDNSKTIIYCDDGHTYIAGENKLFFSTANDASLEKKLIELCMGRKILENGTFIMKNKKNYSVNFTYETKGSWENVGKYAFLILLVVYSLFEIIRRTFYYVSLGTFKPNRF